jgi:DivIVA domain-containing protein
LTTPATRWQPLYVVVVNQDDPEVRIAELERRLAEQTHVAGPEHPDKRPAFSEASRSQGGYHRDEVDAFLDRIEAALRVPTATGGVTAADIDNVAFSKPPIGKRGYDEDEVDAFLDRVRIELTSRATGHGPAEPIHCLLYRLGSRDQQTPVIAIDVDKHALRVIDLGCDELVASASRAEVTATPAHHGGIPVLLLDGPGLPPLTIQPHLEEGFSRRAPSGRLAGRVQAKKPDYFVTDEDWLTLVEKFPVELPEISTQRAILDHILRFVEESRPTATKTWRSPLVLGLLSGLTGCISLSPLLLVVGVVLLILAGLAWYFGWEL